MKIGYNQIYARTVLLTSTGISLTLTVIFSDPIIGLKCFTALMSISLLLPAFNIIDEQANIRIDEKKQIKLDKEKKEHDEQIAKEAREDENRTKRMELRLAVMKQADEILKRRTDSFNELENVMTRAEERIAGKVGKLTDDSKNQSE